MFHSVRARVGGTLVIGASALLWAGETLSAQERIVFGTMASADEFSTFNSGLGLELGGAMYFNRWLGLFGAIHRSPGVTRDDYPNRLRDDDIGLFVVEGTLVASALYSISSGVLFRVGVLENIHLFSRLGAHYSTFEFESTAKVDMPGLNLDLMRRFSNKGIGIIVSLGAGFSFSDRVDVAIEYLYRWTDPEKYIRPVYSLELRKPSSFLPRGGLSIGIQLKM